MANRHQLLHFEVHGDNIETPRATVCLLHGWPDTNRVWDIQIHRLVENGFRCVAISLPLFHEGDRGNKWGYDFPEVVKMVKNTIDANLNGEQEVIVMGHDWGSYVGYLLRMHYPSLVTRLIQFDIGSHVKPNCVERVGILAYQFVLIAFWFLPSFIGDPLTRGAASVLGAPDIAPVKARMNYFYFYMWKRIFCDHNVKYNVQRYRIDCPIFFCFGREKFGMFHSKNFLESIEKRSDSEYKGYACGHWIPTHEIEGEKATEDILQWLNRSY